MMLCKAPELRQKLNISRDFLLAMRYAGFVMPGKRATVEDALAWLKANPKFDPNTTLKAKRPSLQKKAAKR